MVSNWREIMPNTDINDFLSSFGFKPDGIENITSLLENMEAEVEKYNKSKFNIFSSISDIYWRENFHSEILKNILNPKTPDIGNICYLNILVEILNSKQLELELGSFSENTNVSMEEQIKNKDGKEGRIDIFLFDDTINQAIIIENKIANAPDMPDQLARYYEYTKMKKIEKFAILYIPLYEKQPPFGSYSKNYMDYIEDIKKITIVLSAGDLLVFLEKCLEKTINEIARVYIGQYLDLVKSLRGNIMINELKGKILDAMIFNERNYKAAESLFEIWSKRAEIASEVISDKLIEKNGFLRDGINIKKSIEPKKVFLLFKQDKDGFFILGVGCSNTDEEYKKGIRAILENIFSDKKNNVIEWPFDKEHIVQYVQFDFYDHIPVKPGEDIFEKISKYYISIEETLSKL
jgi:hypothetical protein